MEYTEHADAEMEKFLKMVKRGLERHFTGCGFDICSTVKNNGRTWTGIAMREPGRDASPVIYMEQAYQEFKAGRPFGDILSGICKNYEDSREADFDRGWILDFGRAKDRIFFRLINARENEKALRETPHRLWNDLAVVYSLFVAREGEWTVSMPVRDAMLEHWGVDEETLHACAEKNTPLLFQGHVRPIREALSETFGIPAPEMPEDMPMYIAGNSGQYLGSAVVLYDGFLESFAEKAGGSFYILPSSVHEMIFLPAAAGTGREELLSIVREVNRTRVEPEEVLSDNIYFYHADTGDVEMIAEASGDGYAPEKEKAVRVVF